MFSATCEDTGASGSALSASQLWGASLPHSGTLTEAASSSSHDCVSPTLTPPGGISWNPADFQQLQQAGPVHQGHMSPSERRESKAPPRAAQL